MLRAHEYALRAQKVLVSIDQIGYGMETPIEAHGCKEKIDADVRHLGCGWGCRREGGDGTDHGVPLTLSGEQFQAFKTSTGADTSC